MDPYRLHRYLTEKLETLKKFLSISKSMKTCLDLPDMEETTRWMAMREELIRRIDLMDDEVRKMTRESLLNDTDCPEQLRDEIRQLCKAIEKKLQTLKAIDEECQERISALSTEVKAEMQKVFQGMIAVRGYMGNQVRRPKFLDVRR
jgi:methyl-accepting chemotaxis protein